jgi:cell division control protein 6
MKEPVPSPGGDIDFERYLDTILESKIFQDPAILSHNYVPQRLIARDQEIAKVTKLFGTMIKFSSSATNALIHGTTGSGKTVVVRYVLNLVNNALQRRKSPIRILPIYIKCRHSQTQQRILYDILLRLDPRTKVPKSGVPLTDYFDEIYRIMNQTQTSVILVLDEVDLMKGDDVLYNFTRAKGNEFLDENVYANIIAITNNTRYMEGIDPRIKSTLLAEEILFPPYLAPAIIEILEDRRSAFSPRVLDDSVIPLCAAYSAQEHGDARRAIDLLCKAGHLAEQEGGTKVTEIHVRQALEAIDLDCTTAVIGTLPLHTQLIIYAFLIIKEARSAQFVTLGELYPVYCELCQRRRPLEPLGIRRVTDILEELRMLGVFRTRIVSRGRYGRTKEVSTDVKSEQIDAILRPFIDPEKAIDFRGFYQYVFRDPATRQ